MLNREKIKLSDQHRGIKDMKKLPNAIVIVDGKQNQLLFKKQRSLKFQSFVLLTQIQTHLFAIIRFLQMMILLEQFN